MKKWLFICMSAILAVACAESRPEKKCDTYAEAPDPTPVVSDWSVVKGFNASFGSINERYAKSEIPDLIPTNSWSGSGWRGERIAAQAVLWSNDPVTQVECEFTPFKSSGGNVMDASIARARFVRYVLTDEFANGCGHRKPEDFPVSLVADGLDNIDCFDMEAATVRPVWLTFDIPADAEAGIYTSTLKIYDRGEKTKKLNVSIEVLSQILPPVAEWKFHLDLWQHPSAVARVNGVEPWSEEHWKLLEAPMKLIADAGQKVITATLNKEPWNNQCFDPYADMITWTRKRDGSWEYDYKVFDRWVEFMMNLGVKKQINCYSMIPWNNEIHYMDERKGELVNVSAQPGTSVFNELWPPFLRSFRDHLSEKGWLEITNIAMDERRPADMKATIELLERVTPELGIALADSHKSYREYPMLTDICLSYPETFDLADRNFRRDNELVSTFYVCCAHKFPNNFTFSDPAESTFFGWYAMAADFDGFLRWAVNSWVENPLTDSRFRTWPGGDTYSIYPGGRSSIRFERLREGVQDYEKIRILREKFTAEGNREKLQQLETTLAKFNLNQAPLSTSALVDEGKMVLETLSR